MKKSTQLKKCRAKSREIVCTLISRSDEAFMIVELFTRKLLPPDRLVLANASSKATFPGGARGGKQVSMTFPQLLSRGFAARVARGRLLHSLQQSTTMQCGLQRFKALHIPFFYCTFKALSTQDPNTVLASFIAQFCDQRPNLWSDLVKDYREAKTKSNKHFQKLNLDQSHSLLVEVTQKTADICLFLDGPNESVHSLGVLERPDKRKIFLPHFL